jgi:hypothetical protein
MRAYPKPDRRFSIRDSDRPVMQSHAGAANSTNLLEMKRRMPQVGFQELIALIDEVAYFLRNTAVALPKSGGLPGVSQIRAVAFL